MNYKFPIIETINDVLPHIEGREEFRVFDKEWYSVVNYMVAFENTFAWDENDTIGSTIRRECRGLKFNNDGKLIGRPFHKFFNCNERPETQLNKINLYEPHWITLKLDGSMCHPIPMKDGGFRICTKTGVTEVSMNAEVFIADKPHYSNFIRKCIQKGTTPIFEWVSRQNRIVIDYPEDNLILTSIRYLDTGSYVSYDIMKRYAEGWNIPVVGVIDGLAVQNIELLAKQIQEWDTGEEGIVIWFENGHRIKIKSEDYILRHRSKDAINQEKNVIQVLLDDATDDLIPLLTPEDADRIKRFHRAFYASLEEVATQIHDQYQSLNKKGTQKDFALIVQKQVPKHLHHFMFGAYRGESIKDLLINSISKSLSTQTKVNSVRWMFGNLDWNYSDK